MLLRYWASNARGWWFKISVGVGDTTSIVLWKNHRITLIKLPWKHLESSSTHFCFPIFWGRIVSKNENFDAVVIHQFWSKLPETKPQWLILVHITHNFVPKTHFFELRCPSEHHSFFMMTLYSGMKLQYNDIMYIAIFLSSQLPRPRLMVLNSNDSSHGNESQLWHVWLTLGYQKANHCIAFRI